MKKLFSLIVSISFILCFASSSWADLTFIHLDDSGSPVTIDIGVDATTAAAGGIAGAAFTLKHSSELTVNVSSTFFETFTTQGFDASDGLDAQDEVDGYASPLVSNPITSPYSGTRIAAARFEEKTATTSDALFSLEITCSGSGPYSLEIVATKLSNTDAGYDSTGETIDLLIGADETVSDPTDPNAFPKRLQRNADESHVFANIGNITCPTAGTIAELNLQAGWNMVSLPVTPVDHSVSTLFPEATDVYKFTPGVGYEEVTSLEPGEGGYWVKVPAAKTYSISGQEIASYSISLSTGWNMVGAVNGSGITPGTNPAGVITDIYKFTPGVGYEESSTLEDGLAYWVKVSEACVLSVTK